MREESHLVQSDDDRPVRGWRRSRKPASSRRSGSEASSSSKKPSTLVAEQKLSKSVPRTSSALQYSSSDGSSSSTDAAIVVMGVTGSGKSSFISLLTDALVKIGHSLQSCTTEVSEYMMELDTGQKVYLIDTPGFNDTTKSDTDLMRDIAFRLCQVYMEGIPIIGLIYLHRITESRVAGSTLRSIRIFEKLCGHECFRNITLITTMWDLIKETSGYEMAESREQALKLNKDFWGTMCEGGAVTKRHHGERSNAMTIVRDILDNGTPLIMSIQRELAEEGKTLDETSAGQIFLEDIRQARERHERDLAELRESIDEAIVDGEESDVSMATMLEEQQGIEMLISQTNEGRDQLNASILDIARDNAARYTELEEESKRNAEEIRSRDKTIKRLERRLTDLENRTESAQRKQEDYKRQLKHRLEKERAVSRYELELYERRSSDFDIKSQFKAIMHAIPMPGRIIRSMSSRSNSYPIQTDGRARGSIALDSSQLYSSESFQDDRRVRTQRRGSAAEGVGRSQTSYYSVEMETGTRLSGHSETTLEKVSVSKWTPVQPSSVTSVRKTPSQGPPFNRRI